MKTSNKLVILAAVLVLVSLTGYDYLLKAAYVSGKYKDPYNSFAPLKFKDFDTVDIVSSTAINVKFVQGPFSVMIDTGFSENARIKQTGGRLQISGVFEHDYNSDPNTYVLVISCPKLSLIHLDATYSANGKPVTDTIVKEEWKMRQVLVDGFKQDSLSIRQDYGSTLVLSNNHIKLIKAIVGTSAKSGSKLVVLRDNEFETAKLEMLNYSKLLLNDAQIGNLNYHLADSAKLILTGKAQNLLKNAKPPTK